MDAATPSEFQTLLQVADDLRQAGHRLTGGAGGMDIVNDVLDQAVSDGRISAARAGDLYMALEAPAVHEICDVFRGLVRLERPAVSDLGSSSEAVAADAATPADLSVAD